MTKFSSLLSSIEFRANALTMVGNHAGSCLLHLTGAAITIKYMSGEEIASWPYNCIRQFRADEDTGQFSFYSGRRGPYGVAEYKFDMSDQILMELQDALTQFTGAQFGSRAGGAGDRNSTIENRYQPDPTGWGGKQLPISSRSPKHAPLPEIPSTPPNNADMFVGYSNAANPDNIPGPSSYSRRSTLDIFATIPRDPHHRTTVTTTGPPRPVPYASRTIARDRISSSSSQNKTPSPSMSQYKYHEPAGMAASPERGRGGKQVGSTPPLRPKPASSSSLVGLSTSASHHLTKQVTEPVLSTATMYRTHQYEDADLAERGVIMADGRGGAHYPKRSHSFSPEPGNPAGTDKESSDLDFGPLRRSSPQVDRKKMASIRGQITPPGSRAPPPHELYSVPRPATTNSPSPPSGEALYNVPRPHPNGGHSQEIAQPPSTVQSEPENMYNVPRPTAGGSDLYNVPRSLAQNGEMEGSGSTFHSVSSTGQLVQLVRPEQNGQEIYNVPRPATEGSPPKQNGQDIYNVPRPATEGPEPSDEGLYNVPRSVEAPQPENLYNVPRPKEAKRQNYDSLQTVREDVKQQPSTEQALRGTSVRYPASSRMVRPDPGRDTYSVPRPVNPRLSHMMPTSLPRNRYEDVDTHDPQLRGTPTLKPSRSLESLVHRRIQPSEQSTPQQHTRAHRTPSPRSHRYIELDVDTTTPAQGSAPNAPNPENLYAEIPDEPLPRRGSHPAQLNNTVQSYNSNYYTTVPSEGRMVIVMNNSPQTSRHLSHSSSGSPSDKARALHEQGYELCLPADEGSRQRSSPAYHTPPRNVPRRNFPMAQAHSVQMARDGFHRMGSLHKAGEDTGVQLSTSGPVEPNPLTDEYVIVTRQDLHQPTQPKDIPQPQLYSNTPTSHSTSGSGVIPDEPYELMSSVQLQVRRQTVGSYTPGMPPPIPTKQRGSVSSGTGLTSNRTSVSHLRDSLDLDNMSMSETGSVVSAGSSNRLNDLEGQLSPTGMDDAQRMASISNPQTVPAKKNLIRIASGSPHDITPSKDLRSRSLSVGNMLDEAKPQKYVNVTDQELAAKQASIPPFKGSKKYPMPLPRPCRAEN